MASRTLRISITGDARKLNRALRRPAWQRWLFIRVRRVRRWWHGG